MKFGLLPSQYGRAQNRGGVLKLGSGNYDFCSLYHAHARTKEGVAFMQGPCPKGSSRSGIQALEMFGFDVDDGIDPHEVLDWCTNLGVFVVIYPSFNDGREVDGRCVRKYRVVVFLDRMIRREELGES